MLYSDINWVIKRYLSFTREEQLMIKWKEEYRVGIDFIDEQHERLFEIANRVYELLKNDLYFDKYDEIIQVIEELRDYTIFHFKAEEDYMMQIKYRKFFSHKVEHDDFIRKIEELDLENIDKMQNEYLLELIQFIVKWVTGHILETDRLITAH